MEEGIGQSRKDGCVDKGYQCAGSQRGYLSVVLVTM